MTDSTEALARALDFLDCGPTPKKVADEANARLAALGYQIVPIEQAGEAREPRGRVEPERGMAPKSRVVDTSPAADLAEARALYCGAAMEAHRAGRHGSIGGGRFPECDMYPCAGYRNFLARTEGPK